jgi:hypothetical protein
MKWAAIIFGAMLYLVWPYYTLVTLGQAIRSGDAPSINRLVDWSLVRTNLKAQLQARVDSIPKSAADRENPAFAAFGSAFAMTMVNNLIDKMLTPEGITNLVKGARADAAPIKTSQEAEAAKVETPPQESFYKRIKFAFFVSPVHFRLDLQSSPSDPTLTVMMTFKGNGWQISDVRLPTLDSTPRLALGLN